MSTPINHHYVSQCQQREFFSSEKGKIFVYDKEKKNHYFKRTTKTLFSEDNLNTRSINDKIDPSQLELELRVMFEEDYTKHVNNVKKFITDQENKDVTYESLMWLMMLGILGELRHPNFKSSFDSFIQTIDIDVISRKTGRPKSDIESWIKKGRKTKFRNDLGYLDTACRTLERMEPFDFAIFTIESSDIFILPDTSSFNIRGQLHPYINPLIREITEIGIPITEKIFILGTSKHLKIPDASGIQFIRENNSKIVHEINKDLFHFAYKAVAASDDQKLKLIIENIELDMNQK